ncbi:hypothetical protein [Paracholeplasma manati]|uniref:hypothetical protein n=1 Tax=Paracholeplasma manati TaxID=591373 RepID=UPI002407D8F8|nr:hypothetical protein [Paracholeplasma manati]MDG0889175.1 hypothetical protein [Paracholeplasma manati]
MDTILESLKNTKPETEGPVFDNLFNEYQKVILRSIVTTFGLDFIVRDQLGGDVDTIHNVRNQKIGYKNLQNDINYKNREEYDSIKYHSNILYRNMALKMRQQQILKDEYNPDHTIYYGTASYIQSHPDKKASIDHIVSAKEIHEDPARILAGLNGADLANSQENLHVTNVSLNSSKGHLSTSDYIKKNDGKMSETTKTKMKELDEISRKSIDEKISDAYYSSDKFYDDTIKASNKLGIQMGKREAVGFLMVEIYFSCKKRMEFVKPGATFNDYFTAINLGIEDGLINLKNNFDKIVKVLGEGYISGVLSSLSTTLINTFLTTNTALIKNIRTASITLVRATNVLLLNPGNLLLGERYKTTTIIITTGLSSITGVSVGNILKKSSLMLIPEVGNLIVRFIEIFVAGMLSCTFLFMIDRSKTINNIVNYFNKFLPEGYDIGFYSKEFEKIAAYLNGYDIDNFIKECDQLDRMINEIMNTDNEDELGMTLDSKLKELDMDIKDLDDFLDGKKTSFNIN